MKIGDKITNPGELNTQITLLSRSVATGAGGFQSPLYTTLAVVWAKWVNVHGSEAWEAAMAQAMQAATLLIRHRSGIDHTVSIAKGSYTVTAAPASTFTGGVFEIVSLDNISERGEYIELKVRQMKAG